MLTLREWRKAKGMSIREYAERLGVSETTVNKWELHDVNMPVKMAVKACELLEVNISDVIFLP